MSEQVSGLIIEINFEVAGSLRRKEHCNRCNAPLAGFFSFGAMLSDPSEEGARLYVAWLEPDDVEFELVRGCVSRLARVPEP